MKKKKAALVVHPTGLKQWQVDALQSVSRYLEISLLIRTRETDTTPRELQYLGYRALCALSLKGPALQPAALETSGIETRCVATQKGGDADRLPAAEVGVLRQRGIELIINFAMPLEALPGIDIIAYHQRDPLLERGGAPGFHELQHDAERVEILVETQSRSGAERVALARGYSRAYGYSYSKTASDFYRNAALLLKPALENLLAGRRLDAVEPGPRPVTPGNLTVACFALKTSTRYIRRLLYGALMEKRWNVITTDFDGLDDIANLSITCGRVPRLGKAYSFYADPFFSHDGRTIRLEGLNKRNGIGEILELDADTLQPSPAYLKGSHYSYPFSFYAEGREYLLPEVSSHSPPYAISDPFSDAAEIIPLEGFDDKRVLDGTLFRHDGVYYIFGGAEGSAENCLYVYYSRALKGPYTAHPRNPIVIDPRTARMGGRIHVAGGKIYRFGQNNCRGYGDGLAVCEIVTLSPHDYRERMVGSVAFTDASGPHTIDINDGKVVMDFYTDEFSLFAGYRRLSAWLLRRLRRRQASTGSPEPLGNYQNY
ncbi:hypothetical protein KG088_10435 [Halomonas sp. TRM85114]|uniref:glucosamine inositolphosphorylceramide transferase family protein n=1 Tax=Halomonas jincaotanensis TaxID=2810616 RepID=UPI001BD63173|nr:hypothetical protein [Halomonas jincaotanensis]MBS9404048.1 hypothetical protein [Halomonas jincaotanensis]